MALWSQHELNNQISGSIWDAAHDTQKNPVGQVARFSDGRCFRYAKTNSAIAAGDLVAATPNVQEIAAGEFGADASTAPAAELGGGAGDTVLQINIVTGTHTITQDEYAGGYIVITTGTGLGYTYLVESNQANAATGTSTITIKDGLVVALDNTSAAVLVANPYADVATHTAADWGNMGTNNTPMIVGKAVVAKTGTTDQYIWVQTWGMAGVQADTAIYQGSNVVPAEDDDGSAETATLAENSVMSIGVAYAGITDASTDTIDDATFGPIFLQILP